MITEADFGGGWGTPATNAGVEAPTKKFWNGDPHLLLKDGQPISLPAMERDVAAHTANFWRDALHALPEKDAIYQITFIGPVVNKFAFQDATAMTLAHAFPVVRRWADLSAACKAKLRDQLKQVTRNADRQHPEIGTALQLLTPEAESQVCERLSRLDLTATDDATFLRELYTPAVEAIIASTVAGSPLQRHVARQDALNELQALIKKLTTGKPAKPNQVLRNEARNEPNG